MAGASAARAEEPWPGVYHRRRPAFLNFSNKYMIELLNLSVSSLEGQLALERTSFPEKLSKLFQKKTKEGLRADLQDVLLIAYSPPSSLDLGTPTNRHAKTARSATVVNNNTSMEPLYKVLGLLTDVDGIKAYWVHSFGHIFGPTAKAFLSSFGVDVFDRGVNMGDAQADFH